MSVSASDCGLIVARDQIPEIFRWDRASKNISLIHKNIQSPVFFDITVEFLLTIFVSSQESLILTSTITTAMMKLITQLLPSGCALRWGSGAKTARKLSRDAS